MMNDEDSSSVANALGIAAKYQQQAAEMECARVDELRTPSNQYRPKLSIDGNQWCALYGDNLQDGVAGFGDSPYLAYLDFDRAWYAKLSERAGTDAG